MLNILPVTQAEKAAVLRSITQKIRQSLDLPIVLETAVQKIRELMAADRVGIFKFQSDLQFDKGEFVTEAVNTGVEPLATSKIPIPCFFGEKLAGYCKLGRVSAISDIYTAEIPDQEVQFFAKYQVRAALIVPLIEIGRAHV